MRQARTCKIITIACYISECSCNLNHTMAGVSFAGVWYPGGKKGKLSCQKNKTYIPRNELHKLASSLVGAPLTVEHAGVSVASNHACADTTGIQTREILHDIGSKTFYKTGDTKALTMAPIGVVTNAWVDKFGTGHCSGRVENKFPNVAKLVKRKALNGLSLSHYDGTTNAIEVALTTDPAREGCTISVDDILELPSYMRKNAPVDIAKSQPDMEVDTNAAVVETLKDDHVAESPLVTILGKLCAEDQKIVQARFEEMDAAAVTAASRAKSLEATATDGEILKDQIRQIVDTLSEAEQKQYHLGLEAITEQMMSSNPDRVRRGCDRLLVACSRRMMMSGDSVPEAPSAKRTRVAEPAPVQEFAPPVVAFGPSDALRRALASTYDPTVVE